MKRLVFCMVALLLMSGAVMAQQGMRRGGAQKDPKVQAQEMTDRMVKDYSLNDEQKQKVQEANLDYMNKVATARTQMRNANGGQATKEERQKRMEEMKKLSDEHNAQLEKILTKEQYESYIKDQAKNSSRMRNGGQNRQRSHREN